MGKKTRYSDQDRATALAALDANGGNMARTARETGVPRATLQEWAAGRVSADVPELRQEKRRALGDEHEEAARDFLAVARAKAGDLTADKAILAAAIATDKARLCREQPTSIAGQAAGTDEKALADEINALKRRITDLLAGTGILPFPTPAGTGKPVADSGQATG